jgi:hypothetical protein
LSSNPSTTKKRKIKEIHATLKKICPIRHWWLKPVILATQEAEIRRIAVQSQSQANSSRDLISKKPMARKGWLTQ